MTHHSSWPETHAVIMSALKLPAAEREAFLRQHCDDPALCDRLIALLRAREHEAIEAAGSSSEDTEPTLAEGSRVGPYIVLQRLGRGGMGEVFLGRDPRLDRHVALKCLFLSDDGNDDLRLRVIREARAAARISHAHVAAVHDVIEADGRAFIVMEYVEGQSLSVLLKRESLPPQRVVTIGQQLAGALAAAHAGGIIHRDLKPSNIQVMPDGSVKILDFGIALAAAARATSTTRTGGSVAVQQRGAQPGTPAYMSPEQLLGLPVDERTDLFSLALVLFEMTTGRRPCFSTDPLEMLLAAGRRLPRADDIDRAVPRALADVIETGLAPEPRDRFQTALEMGAALAAVQRRLGPASETAETGRWASHAGGWTVRVGMAAAAVPALVWMLGRVSSAGFNTTLERTGAFAWESEWAHLGWGAKSLVAPAGYAVMAIFAYWTVRFFVRVAGLFTPLERRAGQLRVAGARGASRLGLDDPLMLAQGLAVLGLVALAAIIWRFYGLIRAWSTGISTATPEQLWPLGPGNEGEKVLYRAVLTWLLLGVGAGLVHVIHLRLRKRGQSGLGAVAALAAILAVILLLAEAPYRTLWQNEALRIEYAGARCYVIGEAGTRWLVYCPDGAPPRNRVVESTDPAVRRSDVVESIFTPRGTR